MMPKLSPLSHRKLIGILKSLWFMNIRIKWSHHFFRDKNGNTTVVPVHWNEDISVWLLRKIIRDINIDLDYFKKMIEDR